MTGLLRKICHFQLGVYLVISKFVNKFVKVEEVPKPVNRMQFTIVFESCESVARLCMIYLPVFCQILLKSPPSFLLCRLFLRNIIFRFVLLRCLVDAWPVATNPKQDDFGNHRHRENAGKWLERMREWTCARTRRSILYSFRITAITGKSTRIFIDVRRRLSKSQMSVKWV